MDPMPIKLTESIGISWKSRVERSAPKLMILIEFPGSFVTAIVVFISVNAFVQFVSLSFDPNFLNINVL